MWHLIGMPHTALSPDLFELQESADNPLAEGEVRIRNRWLAVDPYLRCLLGVHNAYMPGIPVGSMMYGGALGEVVESRAADLPVGAQVSHHLGWRDSAVQTASACRRIQSAQVPIQSYLSNFGMPGQSAYFGLLDVAQGRAGDVVFVSAAAGAVGSLVVQIAKLKGMTVIASTGGAEKCAKLTQLGADAVLDYKAPGPLRDKLARLAPRGIDVYFDNVGGTHLDAAIESANPGARFALCGMLESYGRDDLLVLPDPMRMVMKQLQLRGFSAPSFDARYAEFHNDALRWTLAGQLRCPETVTEGLEALPVAFCRVFDGANFGKMLVKL